MSNSINFLLKAELHNRIEGEKLQSYLFEREFRVRFLRKTSHQSTYYDPELKMHFGGKPELVYLYEVEINNTQVICGDQLEKSTDFIRRMNYMYDWIQLRVNSNGKITAIENKKELKNQWDRIKSSLKKDYVGEVVDTYLEETDQRLATADEIWPVVSQYFNFGLLFPHIPQKHNEQWEQKRWIEFSGYENEKFEEHTVYEKTENGLRSYHIHINSLEENTTGLTQYEGKITLAENNLLPVNAVIEVVFHKGDVANQWYFQLNRS